MNWEKIEDYLFEKYCVEGEDKELGYLMQEHDRDVYKKAMDALLSEIKENEYLVSDNVGGMEYGIYTVEIEEMIQKLNSDLDKEAYGMLQRNNEDELEI